MAYKLDWTYPNMGKFYSETPPLRGTLNKRVESARKFNIARIEVPFDLIRLENEEYHILQKQVGSIPTSKDFEILYGQNVVSEFDYILHTDPELKPRHYLKWNSEDWRYQYLNSIIGLSKFLGKIPYGIEIHPSRKSRSKKYFEDFIVEAIAKLHDTFGNKCPLLFVENRTSLYISSIEEINRFFEHISNRISSKESQIFGFSIDVMQLYSQMGSSFLSELSTIPSDAIKNWHIHYRHQPPASTDPIDWQAVAAVITDTQPSIILPEVFTDRGVESTIQFVEQLM